MTRAEQAQLVMRHLERAYRANRRNSKDWTKQRGDNELDRAILDAVSILVRQGTPSTL